MLCCVDISYYAVVCCVIVGCYVVLCNVVLCCVVLVRRLKAVGLEESKQPEVQHLEILLIHPSKSVNLWALLYKESVRHDTRQHTASAVLFNTRCV